MSGKRGRNDAADAAAICEAVQRPAMRFVPVKSVDQQSRLMVHRARQGYVQARTATINRGGAGNLNTGISGDSAPTKRASSPGKAEGP